MPKPSKRRVPRQERSKATVAAILDAVSRILRKEGADAVTTNRVADVAGVSIGTLYQYFSSKQDIYEALHEREFDKLSTNVQAALDGAPDTLDAVIETVTRAVWTTRLADPELYLLLVRTVPRRPHTKPEVERLAGAFTALLDTHREALVDTVDFPSFAFTLGTLISGVTSAAAIGGKPSSVSLARAQDEALKAIRAYVALYRRPQA